MIKNTILCILLLIITAAAKAQKLYPDSYYITLQNDTVHATVIYRDIIDIQYALDIIEKNGKQKTYLPGQIKGFCIISKQSLIFYHEYNYEENTPAYEYSQIAKHSFHFDSHGTTPIAKGRFRDPAPDSVLYFETVNIPGYKKIFLNILNGKADPLKHLVYYATGTTLNMDNSTSRIVRFLHLIEKDNRLIGQPKEKVDRWLADVVSDDTLLSGMVRHKELDIDDPTVKFPVPNIEMIVNEYNQWRQNPTDTSITLRGIIDADKYYKPRWVSLATGAGAACALLPGVIVAICMNHEPNAKHLNMPTNHSYCADDTYIFAYKQRAMYKKSRAAVRGVWVGGALGYVFVMYMASTTSGN